MEVTKWDMADYIETPEDVIVYLSTALEEGEPADVINVIAQSPVLKEWQSLQKK